MKNLLKKANRGFYFRITDKITIEIAETQLNICLVNYLGQHCFTFNLLSSCKNILKFKTDI
jgi:hypothetical protein